MAKRFQAPRGTYDAVPGQVEKWQWLEKTFADLAALYGYSEIRTPTFEDTELFVRSSGDTSEVVNKQMYSFMDKGDRNVTLKPEGTAPAIRAYLEHSLAQQGQVTRLWYCTPIFRYERPQKGRCREAHQVGVELIGSPSPVADAEVIELTVEFYRRLGLDTVEVLLNCIGRETTRDRFSAALLSHVAGWLKDQPMETQAKAHKNPLRLLDTKDDELKAIVSGAPSIHGFLEDASKAHFEAVQEQLVFLGVPFKVQADIVRGLDYYTDTVFEVHGVGLGAQSALCGGGRYDNLVKELGGHDTPSVGVAMGIERALIAVEAANVSQQQVREKVFVVADDEANWRKAQKLIRLLRESSLAAQCSLEFEKVSRQMKIADHFGARLVVFVGAKETAARQLTVKDMQTGKESALALDGALVKSLIEALGAAKAPIIDRSIEIAECVLEQ